MIIFFQVDIDKIVADHSTDDSFNVVIANENEILTQVLGKEHPGKPRCYGSFVTSTDIYGSKKKCGKFAHDCQATCEMREEFASMKNKMLEMETNYKSLQEQLQNVINGRNEDVCISYIYFLIQYF